MVIETPNERQRVKQMEERIAQLEAALAQVSLDKFMLETIIMVADEKHGLELKKKAGLTFSTGRSSGHSKKE
jgi:hypothetical protein